jgi:hypothetical protein
MDMKRSMIMLLAIGSLAFGMSAWAGEGHGGKHGGGADRFKQADTNGDGKLSKEEFAAVCKSNADEKFAAADADKDGYLTPDELKAAHGKGKGGHCPKGGKCTKGGDEKKA